MDPPSQVENKINFFLTFIAHVLRKENYLNFNSMKGNFHLYLVKGEIFGGKAIYNSYQKEKTRVVIFMFI